ncbi:MAG: asparagine synthase (glutamine-hydrolyzing) [Dehalococcoidia bacterium]|nr:asparagine synthase (glutamine-hydrolyzing) [Dehalococcoidia bacterium]
MCGIAGIFSSDSREVTPELLLRMTQVLRHRGPDDEGYVFIGTSAGRAELRKGDDTPDGPGREIKHIAAPLKHAADLGLGHRRLSIIDLSTAGHQPMTNEDATIWIIHNGEIYNHFELKCELKDRGHRFRSNTDTEVILHSYEEWGADCLQRFNGMWAFAIWDGRKKKLFCSRDRFGIKPFYYYFDGERFLFASEIKALLEADFIRRRPNDQAIFDYLACWVEDHTEDTFFTGIEKLGAGHYLEFSPAKAEFKISRYYNLPLDRKLSGLTDGEYARCFRGLLEDSIRLRLISDVPLGTCLSGGLDSSAIVCLMDKLLREKEVKLPGTERAQKTFSGRFEDNRCDEGVFINDVIKNTGGDAHFTYPTGEGLGKDLSALIWHQEEPFVTSRTYAQWEVYKLVKQHGIKVALDGQGGDELLAGYDHYYAVLFSYLARTFRWKELARESYFHCRLHGVGTVWRDLMTVAYHLSPLGLKRSIRRTAHVDGRPCLRSEFTSGLKGYLYHYEKVGDAGNNSFNRYLYEVVTSSHLPRVLRHQDKNSMAHSVESRVPFLDYRLVEFALALPWEQKIRRGTRKYILRNAMKGIIPESVRNRQEKIGFDTPEDIWLRTNLKDEVFDIIDSQSFRQRPYFDAVEARQEFDAYRRGRRNNGNRIWLWIVLELWLRTFIDHKA